MCELIVLVYDCGVNFFDNVEIYNVGVVEELMGDVLVDLCFLCDSYCVLSKVYFGVVIDLKLI